MSEKSPSDQVLHHQFRGEGVKTCDPLDDSGGGVQNWPKVDDLICARSQLEQIDRKTNGSQAHALTKHI